ncbi:MAG: hypothetical protein O2973_03435 [Gemmatimonadetes bacterium]|nr:hypothetical protein [Gemmatimonadota bacterium]
MTFTFRVAAAASLMIGIAAGGVGAQIIRSATTPDTTRAKVVERERTPYEAARAVQADFEFFRSMNLPAFRGGRPGNCDERVGRFCYWYDETASAPPELSAVIDRRAELTRALDSLGRRDANDTWILAQRVRYLVEDQRPAEALQAARECTTGTWWCDVMTGFALHMLGEYERADSVYAVGLTKMLPRDRCAWDDISLLLDNDALQSYRRLPCDDPKRAAYEDRAWWYARTLYMMHGNDSRTEHYARMTMALILTDAATPHQFGFDDDERELMLRFGWSIAWMRAPSSNPRGARTFDIISHESVPAYRYIPAGFVLNNPAVSDSADWRLQLPPVMGRYAPPYAKTVRALQHQKAMFRRGDTALVVVSYDANEFDEFRGTNLESAITVSAGGVPRAYQARRSSTNPAGILTVRAPWGPLIMSAEVAAPEKYAIARARYGMSPPYAVGTRVSLSDLLFFKPYGSFPANADEAIPHALPTERVMADEKLGVFWEAYGTDPAGERMTISVTVEREVEDASSFLRRGARVFGLGREVTPVRVSVQDMSARGTPTSARALELDISTLPRGAYVVNLEVEVAGQYVIRAEHRIEIVGP